MASKRASALLCILASVIFTASTAKADAIAERQALYEAVKGDVERSDFVALDKLADHERAKLPTDAAGVPFLSNFYTYISQTAPLYVQGSKCGIGQQKMSEAWLRANPQSVTAQIIYSDALTTLAFCARGTSSADKVPATAWPVYSEYLEMAYNYLMSHQAASYSDPQWFVVMEDIANAQSWSSQNFEALVQKATAQYPLYYTIWYRGMIYYAPKWNGSDGETENFAKQAADSTKTLVGPDLYARLYRWDANFCCIKNLRAETAIDWDFMKVAMRSVSTRYPDASNLKGYAALACGAKDYDEMDYYMHKLLPDARAALAWQVTGRRGHCNDFMYVDSPVYPDSRLIKATAKR